MILLREGASHWIAIFGEGLVGGSLRDLLIQRGASFNFKHVVAWGKDSFKNSLEPIRHTLSSKIKPDDHISFVWSAGRAGFGATQAEVDQEYRDYLFVLGMISNLMNRFQEARFSVHLISSAGGLFEGQTAVHQFSAPTPRRPYGKFKLQQEQALQEMSAKNGRLKSSIYRLSTVYGPIHTSLRMGLIANLIQNGYLRLVTSISGDLTTLRDYVHAADVAKVLVAGIQSHCAGAVIPVTFVLGNKPTSIYEIKSIIEFYLRHKVYIKMQYAPENSMNITFQDMALPFGIQAMDIRCGIKDVLTQWHRRKMKVGS